MFKLKLNNKKIPQYTCPLSSISMNKPCPIHSCHAWHRGKHRSCCLFQFYPTKTEFDRYDLMYAFDCNDKKLREKQQQGKNQIYNSATLFNILSKVRENNSMMFCEQCGVMRTTTGPCINRGECCNRKHFSDAVLRCSLLRFPEYKAKNSDVFLLINSKEKIKQFIDATNQNKEWHDILNLSPLLLEKANLVRTIV